NPVVLRADLAGEIGFGELLSRVRQTVLGALAHQDYPFGLLVEKLQPTRRANRPPWFDVVFVLHQAPPPWRDFLAACALGVPGVRTAWGDLRLESLELARRRVQFDLTLLAAKLGDRLTLVAEYRTELF